MPISPLLKPPTPPKPVKKLTPFQEAVREIFYTVEDNLTFFIVFFAIFGTFVGFYAYFYFFMVPEVNLTDIQVRYSQSRDTDTKFNFLFKIKNTGNGKAIHNEFYSSFLNFRPNTDITAFGHHFAPLKDLVEEQKTALTWDKSMDYEEFIHRVDTVGGIFATIVLRWKSDNPVFWGRTFENGLLVFLRPSPGTGTLDVEYIEQIHLTHWFDKNLSSPDMVNLIKKLDSIRLIYEDIITAAQAPEKKK